MAQPLMPHIHVFHLDLCCIRRINRLPPEIKVSSSICFALNFISFHNSGLVLSKITLNPLSVNLDTDNKLLLKASTYMTSLRINLCSIFPPAVFIRISVIPEILLNSPFAEVSTIYSLLNSMAQSV